MIAMGSEVVGQMQRFSDWSEQFILVVSVTENRNARRIGNIWFAGAVATVVIASGRKKNAELEIE
jgi:hypothetical protein